MAKTKQQEVVKDEVMEVEKTPTQEMAGMPDDLKKYEGKGGVRDLDSDDVRPPRLLLAQAMSPQVKRSEATYIEGLQERNLFNSLSGQVYGDGPIDVVVIKYLGVRGVQFGPELGDPIVDRNVAKDDIRMKFTPDPEKPGQFLKPIATKFYDYLVWLSEFEEGPLLLSMKSTQLNAAKTINSLIRYMIKIDGQLLLEPPAWARTLSLGTIGDKRDKYTFANFTVAQKGITPRPVREICASIFESFEGKNVIVDDDATDGAIDSAVPVDKDVPF